jgi:hypothetical protein
MKGNIYCVYVFRFSDVVSFYLPVELLFYILIFKRNISETHPYSLVRRMTGS